MKQPVAEAIKNEESIKKWPNLDQYKVDKEGALTDNPSLRLLDGLDYSIKNMLTKRHAKLNNDTFLPQGLPVQGFFTIEKRKSFPITEFHLALGF